MKDFPVRGKRDGAGAIDSRAHIVPGNFPEATPQADAPLTVNATHMGAAQPNHTAWDDRIGHLFGFGGSEVEGSRGRLQIADQPSTGSFRIDNAMGAIAQRTIV